MTVKIRGIKEPLNRIGTRPAAQAAYGLLNMMRPSPSTRRKAPHNFKPIERALPETCNVGLIAFTQAGLVKRCIPPAIQASPMTIRAARAHTWLG
jgi:hypothetical protein